MLDIYLIYEFFKIQDSNQVEVQTQTEASFEKNLKDDEIEYVDITKRIIWRIII